MYLLTQAKTGISSLAPSRQLGISQNSAWLLKHKLMQAILEREASRQLVGLAQIDNAYWGGRRRGCKRGRGIRGKRAFAAAGCLHAPAVMSGPGLARRRQSLNWVDTVLGNVKNAIHGTDHAIRSKHLPLYLAEFSYRFNRRHGLRAMLAWLATAAAQAPPMPYRLVRLAEPHW